MSSIPGLSQLLRTLFNRTPVPPQSLSRTGAPVGPPTIGRTGRDELTLGFHQLADVLGDSRAAVLAAAKRASRGLDGPQADLDAAARSIRDTEDLFESGGNTDGPQFQVVNVSRDVSSYSVRHVTLQGHPLDVNVVVTQSAQQGGLYLSFGGANLDLAAANSSFTIDIGGRMGVRRLTFASGTTLSDIATAINSYGPSTGIKARVIASAGTHSNGIKLEAVGFGADSFTSVRVISDGGMSIGQTGLYGLAASNTHAVNITRISNFRSRPELFDYGQDVGGTVNGQAAVGHGLSLALLSPSLGTRITLGAGRAYGTANAQTLGAMLAFRLEP